MAYPADCSVLRQVLGRRRTLKMHSKCQRDRHSAGHECRCDDECESLVLHTETKLFVQVGHEWRLLSGNIMRSWALRETGPRPCQTCIMTTTRRLVLDVACHRVNALLLANASAPSILSARAKSLVQRSVAFTSFQNSNNFAL